MRIFISDDKYSKINFVDEKNVFVGFDNEGNCCERWGFMITDEVPDKSFDIDWDKQSIHEKLLLTNPDFLKSFRFDQSFYFKQDLGQNECESMCTFKLYSCNDSNSVYLTIFNYHNGYYSHGFEFCDGNVVMVKDYL